MIYYDISTATRSMDIPIMSRYTDTLPVHLTPFVGRQADLEKLLAILHIPSIRLVTILGTGGIGKTRLAAELAHTLQDQFQQGVVFIPLAQLCSVDELLPAIAGALGVQLPPGGDLQQAVQEYLASRQMLLVLDNFEHLVEEASLVFEILINAPHIKVLVTSREKLNLEAETLYHLSGLQFPPLEYLEHAQDFDAIHLFLYKAGQVQPRFSLNQENASDIIRICRLVDGNALGILMAAAWVEHFSPAEIADEIDNSFDFLSSQARDIEPRHCCMGAVFDSSYNRLDEPLKAVFRKLGVFCGGFDLPAAKSVAGADLRSLIALVNKSLVTRNPETGRYELHQLLRQYALAKLEIASDRENILVAYTNYYIAFVSQRERQLISPKQTVALDEIQADFDNIRQASMMVVEKRDFTSVLPVIPGLYTFCDMRSRFYEGEVLFRLASEVLAPRVDEMPQPAWALSLLSWYDMRTYIEPFESFDEIALQAQSCLAQARAVGDAQTTAASLVLLGVVARHRGDFEAAIRNYEEALRSHPDLEDVYFVNIRIGLCHQAIRDYPRAIDAFQISLQHGRKTGERVKIAWSLENIGDTLLLQGKPSEAEPYYEQAYALFEEVGTTIGIVWCLYGLSRAALALHNVTRARELAETAGRYARQIHSGTWVSKTNELLRQVDPFSSQIASEKGGEGNESFSLRELEILQLLKSDLNGPAIAQKLVVSLNTVRYHTKNIYRKLGAGTRLEALQRARQLGL
jgi:predicted ATPase/DNA-binding CsgD family transcriptional regulator